MQDAALENRLSWSKSRAGVLSDCPRQYYYAYYGSWGGWDPRSDPRTRELYMLKQLRGRHAWAGEVVHSSIQWLLEQLRLGQPLPPLAQLKQDTRERMRRHWKRSRDGVYRQRPRSLALFEHEYAQQLAAEEWRAIAEHVDRCLEAFWESPTFERIRELPLESWLELEELSSFVLDGVTVNLRLDFSWREGDEVVLVDWKTGKAGDHSLQFACYTMYACQRWQLEPEQVRGVEVRLASRRHKEHRFGASDLDRHQQRILSSIKHMRELLRDPESNDALQEDFPRRERAHVCGRCNFKRVCEPELG